MRPEHSVLDDFYISYGEINFSAWLLAIALTHEVVTSQYFFNWLCVASYIWKHIIYYFKKKTTILNSEIVLVLWQNETLIGEFLINFNLEQFKWVLIHFYLLKKIYTYLYLYIDI